MSNCKRGNHRDETAYAAQWNHETEQKQEMVDAFKDVQKAHFDEAQCGLIPTRIQLYQTRIANVVENPLRPSGDQES